MLMTSDGDTFFERNADGDLVITNIPDSADEDPSVFKIGADDVPGLILFMQSKWPSGEAQ